LLTHNYYDTDLYSYDMDYCHVRFLIEQRRSWATLFNIQANSIVFVLQTYFPPPSHVFCERFALGADIRRTMAISLYNKSAIDTEGVCEAVNHLPVDRAERRRVLREIRGGRDILRLTLDDIDEAALARCWQASGTPGRCNELITFRHET
jgi:hypothetical protein